MISIATYLSESASGNPKQAGEVGDYMVQLWPPGPNPENIKVQKITAVEECEPEGMIGVWKAFSNLNEADRKSVV